MDRVFGPLCADLQWMNRVINRWLALGGDCFGCGNGEIKVLFIAAVYCTSVLSDLTALPVNTDEI